MKKILKKIKKLSKNLLTNEKGSDILTKLSRESAVESEAKAEQKNFFKKLLKKYLTNAKECDIIARSLGESA